MKTRKKVMSAFPTLSLSNLMLPTSYEHVTYFSIYPDSENQ